MQDQDQYPDVDDGLRLEDISRRSACDRCRRMKTRCERSHHRDIAQLQQCRRCRQANVRCITTLEAQQHQNDNSDKPSQRNLKRPRPLSLGPNNSCQVPETLGSLGEQHHTTLPEQLSGPFTAEIPSSYTMPADSTPDYGLLPSHEINHHWHELSESFDLDGNAIHNLNDSHARATAVPQESLIAISSTSGNSDSTTFTEGTTISSAISQSITDTTPFNQTPQESRNLFWRSLSTPSLSESSNRTIMSRLMEFNNKVSHDLQEVTGITQPWGDGKSMLVKTLQHSLVFLEILGSFNHSKDAFDGSSSGSESTGGSRYGGSTLGQGDNVDIDMALQLLSCNMNVWSMYRRLYMELTTQSWQLEEAHGLPSLRLEGLQSLDTEMRVQVLVHMCSLTLVKIQTELQLIRRRGLLTQKAERTFETVLGVGNEGVSGPGLGIEQILANFRRLLMARELLSP